MAIRKDHVDDLKNILTGISMRTTGLKSPQRRGKVFEAYVFAHVFEEIFANVPGLKWNYVNYKGARGGKKFVFRKTVGVMNAASTARNPPGSLDFEFGGTWFEMVNSVKWQGASKVSHQIDIAIVPKNDADAARRAGAAHPARILYGIECKAWLSSLGASVIREASGYVLEFCPARMHVVSHGAEDDPAATMASYYSLPGATICRRPNHSVTLALPPITYTFNFGNPLPPALPRPPGSVFFGNLSAVLSAYTPGVAPCPC